MIDDIAKEISVRRDEILSNINQESISVYLFLKDQYKKGDIKNNTLFHFVLRSYYRLDNAGLGDALKKRYFELLEDRNEDLEVILEELYKIPTERNIHTVQFSFATKLLHTINENSPIFDSEVSVVIHKRVTGDTKEDKIKSCREAFDFLKETYTGLLKEELVREVVSEFRDKFKVSASDVSDIKVLDFIVWSLGKLKKKKS